MTIVLAILLVFALLAFCGYGVTRLLGGTDKLVAPYVLIAGYAFSQVAYFLFYLLWGGKSGYAALSVLGMAFLLGVGMWFVSGGRAVTREWWGGARGGRHVIAAATVVFLIASSPYLVSGWGGYWHSANEDMIDGVLGGEAYHQGKVFSADEQTKEGVLSLVDILKRSGVDETKLQRYDYVLDVARGQYSSLGFWAEILGESDGLDLFVIQALVNLILMLQGVYLFARRVGGVGVPLALVVALGAVLNNFYLTTYFNGHHGSLMAMSALPFILTASVNWVDGKFPHRGLWLIALLLLFVMNTYPYPLLYFVVPSAIYLYVKRSSWYTGCLPGEHHWITQLAIQGVPKSLGIVTQRGRALLWIAVAAVAVVIFAVAWDVVSPLRERLTHLYRSWGTMLNYVGFFQYWGIWHSTVVYGITPISLFDRIAAVVWVSWVLAGTLTVVAVKGAVVLIRRDGRAFFEVFAICWVVFFILMRVFIGDSYYVYKFLYITQFVVVLLVAVGFHHLWKCCRRLKILAGGAILGLVGLNVGNNLVSIGDLMQRDYNASFTQYLQVKKLGREVWARTYLDIPRYDHRDVISKLLAEEKIYPVTQKRAAQYVLTKKGVGDVVVEPTGKLLWENRLFELREAPKDNVIQLYAAWEPKKEDMSASSKGEARWIGEGGYGLWSVDVARRTHEAKYLYLCAESGPSNGHGDAEVSMSDQFKKELLRFVVSQRKCDFFSLEGIEDEQFPLVFQNHTTGKPASSVDPRKLHIRLFQAGLSEGQYNWPIIELLNPGTEVIKTARHETHAEGVYVGHGWYPLENYQGEWFHWMPGQAELVVNSPAGMDGVLELQLESGPSLSPNHANVRLTDSSGHIQEVPLKGRQTISFPLTGLQKGFNVVTLQAETMVTDLEGDRRILAARLMSVEWKPAK